MADANTALRTSFYVKLHSNKALSSNIQVKNKSSKAMSCIFWVNKPAYTVERISNGFTQMSYTPATIATDTNYATVLEMDVKGYEDFTIVVAAGDANDITYRIQALLETTTPIWAAIPSQADIDVTSSDPQNMGTVATFYGAFSKIRVQAKQKSSAGRAWASLRASRHL